MECARPRAPSSSSNRRVWCSTTRARRDRAGLPFDFAATARLLFGRACFGRPTNNPSPLPLLPFASLPLSFFPPLACFPLSSPALHAPPTRSAPGGPRLLAPVVPRRRRPRPQRPVARLPRALRPPAPAAGPARPDPRRRHRRRLDDGRQRVDDDARRRRRGHLDAGRRHVLDCRRGRRPVDDDLGHDDGQCASLPLPPSFLRPVVLPEKGRGPSGGSDERQ